MLFGTENLIRKKKHGISEALKPVPLKEAFQVISVSLIYFPLMCFSVDLSALFSSVFFTPFLFSFGGFERRRGDY